MRFVIKHEIKGRLRVHVLQSRMSFAQADTLQYYLDGQKNIVSAKIQERTLDVTYRGILYAVVSPYAARNHHIQQCRSTSFLLYFFRR